MSMLLDLNGHGARFGDLRSFHLHPDFRVPFTSPPPAPTFHYRIPDLILMAYAATNIAK